MSEAEIELPGGNVNAGVVRVGNTVRRQLTPASATVHELLQHLARKGFVGSPRFLGIDEQGREILSFIEGEVGIRPFVWQSDAALTAVAHMLRAYHDATVDFKPSGLPQWAFTYPEPQRHEVICHNDFALYNFIYRDEIPYAVIDFDLVGPGPRWRDIAYAAYWTVPLSFYTEDMKAFAEADVAKGSRRCHLFCQTYGMPVEPALLDMVAEILTFMGNEADMRQVVGEAAATKLKQEGHLAHWRREASAFQSARPRLEVSLWGKGD